MIHYLATFNFDRDLDSPTERDTLLDELWAEVSAPPQLFLDRQLALSVAYTLCETIVTEAAKHGDDKLVLQPTTDDAGNIDGYEIVDFSDPLDQETLYIAMVGTTAVNDNPVQAL